MEIFGVLGLNLRILTTLIALITVASLTTVESVTLKP